MDRVVLVPGDGAKPVLLLGHCQSHLLLLEHVRTPENRTKSLKYFLIKKTKGFNGFIYDVIKLNLLFIFCFGVPSNTRHCNGSNIQTPFIQQQSSHLRIFYLEKWIQFALLIITTNHLWPKTNWKHSKIPWKISTQISQELINNEPHILFKPLSAKCFSCQLNLILKIVFRPLWIIQLF